jgi:hypothetical protein
MKHFILTYGFPITAIGFFILLFQHIPNEIKQRVGGFWNANLKRIQLALWAIGFCVSAYLLYYYFLEPMINKAGGIKPAIASGHHKKK